MFENGTFYRTAHNANLRCCSCFRMRTACNIRKPVEFIRVGFTAPPKNWCNLCAHNQKRPFNCPKTTHHVASLLIFTVMVWSVFPNRAICARSRNIVFNSPRATHFVRKSVEFHGIGFRRSESCNLCPITQYVFNSPQSHIPCTQVCCISRCLFPLSFTILD